MWLLQYPGAVVRYFVMGRKKAFKAILQDYSHENTMLGGLLLIIIAVTAILIVTI